jgi:hypothetical protein
MAAHNGRIREKISGNGTVKSFGKSDEFKETGR